MNQVILPGKTENQAGARLDAGAILEAVEVLEIEGPVEIKWMNGRRIRGRHRFFPDEHRHLITVSTYMVADQVTKTLWHELTHAVQSERVENEGKSWHAESRRAKQRGFGTRYERYRASPYEVEARSVADQLKDEKLATQTVPVEVAARRRRERRRSW